MNSYFFYLIQLDLLIIGGYFGVGIRSGMISHFLCAVAVPPEQRGQHPNQFYSFCKDSQSDWLIVFPQITWSGVGTGYTLDELRELGNKLKPHWQPFKTNKPPKTITLASGFKEKPDVWIEPCKSKIVQIKAAEIIPSDRYKTGATLRFPRLECVRDDKHWHECLDLTELEKLRTMAEGKLTHQHTDMEGTSEPTRKKRRVAARVEQPRSVAAHFRPADVSSVTEVSKLFEGKEFCIINGPANQPKSQLEKKVVEHGGTFTQNPGPETYCVISERVNLRVNNIIKDAKYDVVKASWLTECLNQTKLLPWLPTHMIHCSPGTEQKFVMQYDSYGDSFTQDASEESLKKVFYNFEKPEKSIAITTEEIAGIEQRYFPDQSPLGLFRHSRVYLDQFKVLGDPNTAIKDSSLELTTLELRFYGASISSEFDENVTHVVLDKRDLTRLPELQQRMRSREQKHHFVTQDWVSQSIEKGYILQERPFAPTSTAS